MMKKSIEKTILLNKKEGQTPLQALELFRKKNKQYEGVPMTYAGRLDPMASGVMLVLSGEETKNKEKYLGLNKEYEFEVLFGFATDTYDILGKVARQDLAVEKGNLEKSIKQNTKYFIGKFNQEYPLYSSKNIKKVLAGEEVSSTEKEVNVSAMRFLGIKSMSSSKLLQIIQKRINKVDGDFRQEEIIKLWSKNLQKEKGKFFIASFKIKCSTGTYVRSISNSLGEKMGIPALAFAIKRTKLGKWRLVE